jgi:uncharacterized membrane protein YgcG
MSAKNRGAGKDARDMKPHERNNSNSQSNGIKNTLNVQIHHLRKRTIRMRIELLTPRCAGICKQNIHVVRRLAHFFDEVLHTFELRAVGRHGDCFCARLQVRQGAEGGDGGLAGGGFAGGDVDFGGAGLEESAGGC